MTPARRAIAQAWIASPLTDERLLEVAADLVDCDLCSAPNDRPAGPRSEVAEFLALHDVTPESLRGIVDELA